MITVPVVKRRVMTRKYIRVLLVALIWYSIARISIPIRWKTSAGRLDSNFEFAALVKEKSGARKRIPPDSNYTSGTSDSLTRQGVHLHTNAHSHHINENDHINANNTWRARKFTNPGAFKQKDIEGEPDPILWLKATNHTAPQMEQLRVIFSRPWNANRDAILQFGKQLQDLKASAADVILTKNNTKVGKIVRYALNRDQNASITEEIYSFLPEDSPFDNSKLPLCSVVGNGGIVLGKKCGAEIDNADFVFRCNMPQIKGFESDVGRRSNFTTINAVSTLKLRYHFMQTKSHSMKFVQDAQRLHGFFWMPVYGLKHGLSFNLRVAREVFRSKKLPNLRLIIGNPDHFSSVQDLWSKRLGSSRISTGLYVVTLAMSLCEETHVHGFWPYAKDLNLQSARYHYFDETGGPTSVHSFSEEFGLLMDMHRAGLLRLHVDQCT